MLAETRPELEAANLQADQLGAGMGPGARIINNTVAAARPHASLLRQLARDELPEMDAVAARHAKRYAVLPLPGKETAGVDRLLEMARHHIARQNGTQE